MIKTIDNIKIEFDYTPIGKQTLVFLHGFLGNLNSFENYSKTFQNYGFSTLNINLTGYGFKHIPKTFTIYDYAQVVFKLIKSLKIKSCCLIGHSFGGRIAIILSSMFNFNFEKLILVDSAGIKPKFSLKTKLKILNFKLNKFLVKKNLKNKEVLNKFGSKDYKMLSENLKPVFKNIVNEDLTYLLKNINCKTLIIFGKTDADTPIYMAKILHKKIKNSTLKILDGGHFCYQDSIFQFTSILKKFLEEN